ncbi:MAG: Ig-like domain-containing protein [Candidatus Bipolaricaulia bacterium]
MPCVRGANRWMRCLCLALAVLVCPSVAVGGASSGDIVINEIAWMGTQASSSDGWIEFHSTTSQSTDISDWSIFGADTGECLNLADADGSSSTSVPGDGYLIYANHADDVQADSGTNIVDIWDATIGLNDSSPGKVVLYDAPDCQGTAIDAVNTDGGGWPAGDSGTHATMERIDPATDGSDDNWATNDGSAQNGQDADGNDIHGTPKATNSVKPTNQAPTCANVSLTVDAGGSGSIAPDCSDPDNDSLRYAIVDTPEHGSAAVDNGKLRYTPDADYVGSDTFTYRADDGQATSGAATVDVEVSAAATEGDGDPDNDGAIDAVDARVCHQIANGMGSVSNAGRTACDVDGDGTVDRDDAERIAERAIGLIDDVNARGWWLAVGLLALGLPAAWRHRSTSARSALLSALLVGLAGLLTACPSLIPALPQDAVGIQATVSSKAIRVEVQNMPNGGVASVGIGADALTFNADALRIQDVQPADGWTVLARDIDNDSGDVRLVAVQTNSGTTDGRILTLALQQRAGFSRGAADVEWNSTQLTLGDAANTEIDDFQTGTQP